MSNSKPIIEAKEEAMILIKDILDGRFTHGINVDSLYFTNRQGWVVIEFLRCKKVRPFNSHPNYYWHLNWQKFRTLWAVTKCLHGVLILINFEDLREQFRVIRVIDIDGEKSGGILKEEITDMYFDEFKEWFCKINDNGTHMPL